MLGVFTSFIATRLGKYALIAAAVAAVFGGVWLNGYSKGKARVQAKWDAAVAAEQKAGHAARARAESVVRSGGVRNDPFNRIK